MSYQRKTYDTWEIWTNYGYGWELETTELSWREMRTNVKAYRENCPGIQLKVKKRRVRKDAEQ